MSQTQTLAPDNAVGHPAEDLLAAAIDQGGAELHRLATAGVQRALSVGHINYVAGLTVGQFLTDDEVEELAQVYEAILGTAELLGRALVRDREQQVLSRRGANPQFTESAPVPRRQQDNDYRCGPAALQAILARWGIKRPEAWLGRQMGTDPNDGTRPRELLAMIQAIPGLRAEERHGLTVKDLRHVTEQGVPCLCCVQMHGGGHWVVVCDVDQAGRVQFMDPAEGGYQWADKAAWDAAWHDTSADDELFDHYGIAVGPARRTPVSEERRRLTEMRDASGHEHAANGQFGSGGGGGDDIRANVAGATATSDSPGIAGVPTLEHRAAAERWAATSSGLSPETTAEYVEHLSHALSVLPVGVSRDANESLGHGGVRFHPDLKALRAESQRIAGKSAAGVVGFAHDRGMATDLHLDGGDDPRGTYVHELWHAADNGGFHSDDKGWQAAYKKDILKGKHMLSRYAMTNPSEGFAEFGRALATHGVEYMAQRFPTAVRHLQAKGLL